jgi:hypothetical protein
VVHHRVEALTVVRHRIHQLLDLGCFQALPLGANLRQKRGGDELFNSHKLWRRTYDFFLSCSEKLRIPSAFAKNKMGILDFDG